MAQPPLFESKPSAILAIVYDEDELEAFEAATVEEVIAHLHQEKTCWITFEAPFDRAAVDALLVHLQLDPLLADDIIDEHFLQFEGEYEDCLYLEFEIPILQRGDNLQHAHGSFILGSTFLLQFNHESGLFARIRRKILARQTKVMRHKADYLLYLLVRAVILENFHQSMKAFNQEMEALEDEVLASPGADIVFAHILEQRERVKPLYNTILQFEEFLSVLKEGDSNFISNRTLRLFTINLYDQADELLREYTRLRAWLIELVEIHQANVSENMNTVMKTLTTVATIFLPLTFIAGVYGMNFRTMPELRWPWGYPAVLLLMLAIGVGSLVYMRRKRWI